MQTVNIQLEQTWDTLDEAIDYFLGLVLDLKVLKRLPDPPKELFLHVETTHKIPDGCFDDLTITLTNL